MPVNPQQRQPATRQIFLVVVGIILGLSALMPAYLGIQLWQRYQEGAFPPLSLILHRQDIIQVVITHVEDGRSGRLVITDAAGIERCYRALVRAEHPVLYKVPAGDNLPGPRSVRFFRNDGTMLPVELGIFDGGALWLPTLHRSFIDDSGNLYRQASDAVRARATTR